MLKRFRDETMKAAIDSPNIRKGRFLWMEPDSRAKYLQELSHKIMEGYFTSESILDKVVEEIAPAFGESLESKA
jgi:hypothetical protein